MEVTPLYRKLQKATSKVVSLRGGTRSGKSYAMAQLAVYWLFSGKIHPAGPVMERGTWDIVRRALPSLKATVLKDFREILAQTGQPYDQNLTDLVYSFGGRSVCFYSVDDPQKLRSRKRDFIHLVESNEVEYDAFLQIAFRTTTRIFCDFNPDDSTSWLKTEIEEKRADTMGDVTVIVSTYRDNPTLSELEVREIEYLKVLSPELFEVFGNGEWGVKFKN